MDERHAGGRSSLCRCLAVALLTAGILTGGQGAGAVMRDTDCDDLDIALEPAADFRSIECEAGQETHGAGSGTVGMASIEAEDALSFIVVYHDRAGNRTYLSRVDPRRLFGKGPKFAIEDSWATTTSVSSGFTVRTFFGKLKSVPEKMPCFVFSRYAGHVAHSTGFRHMVGGVYCEVVPSDQPVTSARIDQMMGKIRGDMF
ncbi:MAG: hypothetical protein ACKVOI_04100 [Dongiaceae bacterium]